MVATSKGSTVAINIPLTVNLRIREVCLAAGRETQELGISHEETLRVGLPAAGNARSAQDQSAGAAAC
jgi:hypothetical protein